MSAHSLKVNGQVVPGFWMLFADPPASAGWRVVRAVDEANERWLRRAAELAKAAGLPGRAGR